MHRFGWLLVLALTLAVASTASAHSMAVMATINFPTDQGGQLKVELRDPYENLIPQATGHVALAPKGEEPKQWIDMKEGLEGVHTAVLPKPGENSVLHVSFLWTDDAWAAEVPLQAGKPLKGEIIMLRQLPMENPTSPSKQQGWPWWIYPAYGAAVLLIGWGFWQTFWSKEPK